MSLPMETESAIHDEKAGPHAWGWTKALPGKAQAEVTKIAKNVKKLGQDDPRIVMHSLKVGLALTLVSLLYYSRSLYDGFGVSGMWAVLTVVVVFEFTLGGTLSKSINRGFATLAAGALGVGAQHFASLFGEKGEPIVLGLLVFLLAAASTFTRFFPKIKARYDYGVLVFILTFCLVSVSGYRIEELLTLANQRLSTIIIGGATCILISACICPVWAGEDLHFMVASNIEKLGSYLEGFGAEYIGCSEDDKSSLEEYKSVLNSKSTEDSMANLAWWEPSHGQFRFQHPWNQYLKIGALSRKCAYQIEALNGFINSDIQIQVSQESQTKIFNSCKKISEESGKAMKSLASAIKTMTDPSPANFHLENSKLAIEDLKFILKAASLDDAGFLSIAPAATAASILIEIVNCVDELYKSVQELSNLAHFKSAEPALTKDKSQSLHHASVKAVSYDDSNEVVITMHRIPADSPDNESTKPSKPGRLEEV